MSERTRIPSEGQDPDEVLAQLRSFRDDDADYRHGRTWSLVYYVGDEHHAFLERAHDEYLAENALNPMAFQSLRRMASEVVQMTAGLLHGPDDAVGTMTSGGTESLLLAVKAARDRARRKWPWILRPNVVVPDTIHVAFDKAGHYFDVDIRRVPARPDGTADVKAMRRAMNRNTILLAASAPQYPTGSVDPIPALGALAQRKNVPLHVDACFGGFLLPWLERLGVDMPRWDFRVPGVTSMSADVHKYGYAAKGASVILYRDMSHLQHQFFVKTGWMGGIYASPGLPGTRPGGPIAAAWATLHKLGEQGYLELARTIWSTAERLREGIGAIPELRVLGRPHASIVTWASADDNVAAYAVADRLEERGWMVDRQSQPPCVHCSVSPVHAEVVDDYLADLRAAVTEVKAHPELASSGKAAVYGMMARIPVDALVEREVLGMMKDLYGTETKMPDMDAEPEGLQKLARQALDALDRLRDRLA